MRNREAARYARWSAIIAGLVAAGVALGYADRAFREVRARARAPKPVPVTVEQQSSQFSFSKEEGNRKLFTLRASSATQYKDQNRALLEDVWITIYGRQGTRNDNIHTHECSYEPETGEVRCEGEVEIEIASAEASGQARAASSRTLEARTSDLSFNRNTGEASTPARVEFRFPAGQGHGVGVAYSTGDGVLRIERDVAFQIAPSQHTGDLPVDIRGSALEIRRNNRTALLNGPCDVREGPRELEAATISVEFDEGYHARRVVVEGHPRIRSRGAHENIAIAADQITGSLDPAGWIDSLVAEGNISGSRRRPGGADRFSARRAEFSMVPTRNLASEMTASGGVVAELDQGGDTRVLRTDALRVKFAAGSSEASAGGTSHEMSIEGQRVESVESLAPAVVESKTAQETMTLKARELVSSIGPKGSIEKLFGHSGVEVERQSNNGAPQFVSASEMSATFDQHGEWNAVEVSGSVSFRQGDHHASAGSATIVRATEAITLEGSPEISDSTSQTIATRITIRQNTGEIGATGGVISTYVPAKQADVVSLGAGTAHVSADKLNGSVDSGHFAYAGHARLWQGDAVLDSDQIELWRDAMKLQATGHVVAAFPQAAGPLSSLPAKSVAARSVGPTLWKISAPALTYWGNEGKAHWEGGVRATSDQGSLASQTLDASLETTSGVSSVTAAAPGGRQLSRVLARGNVVVRQGDRRGTAEQAEYTSADGKFVLSGGQPTLTNAASDTTTGHSLTFFVADDTILIDSQEGSRTVTKHRIEK